jgi:hypothetical protein
MRPEFVTRHDTPLCCDAYSYFGVGGGAPPTADIRQHNAEINDATHAITHERVDACAALCGARWGAASSIDALVILDGDVHRDAMTFVSVVHRHGVNLRYLGVLRTRLLARRHTAIAAFVLREMLARCVCCVSRGTRVCDVTASPQDTEECRASALA